MYICNCGNEVTCIVESGENSTVCTQPFSLVFTRQGILTSSSREQYVVRKPGHGMDVVEGGCFFPEKAVSQHRKEKPL